MPKNYLLPMVNFYEIDHRTNQNGYGVLKERYYHNESSLKHAKKNVWDYLLGVIREHTPRDRTIKTIIIYEVNGTTKEKRQLFKKTTKELFVADISDLKNKEMMTGDKTLCNRYEEILNLLNNNKLIHPEDFALLALRFKHHQLNMVYPTKFQQWLCSSKAERVANLTVNQ